MRQGYKQRCKPELSSTIKSNTPFDRLKNVKEKSFFFIPTAVLPMGMFSYDV